MSMSVAWKHAVLVWIDLSESISRSLIDFLSSCKISHFFFLILRWQLDWVNVVATNTLLSPASRLDGGVQEGEGKCHHLHKSTPHTLTHTKPTHQTQRHTSLCLSLSLSLSLSLTWVAGVQHSGQVFVVSMRLHAQLGVWRGRERPRFTDRERERERESERARERQAGRQADSTRDMYQSERLLEYSEESCHSQVLGTLHL